MPESTPLLPVDSTPIPPHRLGSEWHRLRLRPSTIRLFFLMRHHSYLTAPTTHLLGETVSQVH
jgi:hypothetical protein